jgi:hypothetical protein
LDTQAVGDLSAGEVDEALAGGTQTAERLLQIGLIRGAAMNLAGQTRVVGLNAPSRMISTAVPERGLVNA